MSDEEIRDLVLSGWKSVSRKHGIIARLPIGMTGKQALSQHNPRLAECMSQADAEGHYLRVHGQAAGLWLELQMDDFIKFRKLGGETAR